MPYTRVTALELRLVDVNGLALNTTLYYAADLSYAALDIGLASALFGTSLTILAYRDSRIRRSFDDTDRHPDLSRHRRGDFPAVRS